MAITAASFTVGHGGSGTSYTTASKTWVSGRQYTAFVYSAQTGQTTPTPTVTGMTQVFQQAAYQGNAPCLTLFAWVGDGSTGTKTIDFGAQTQNACSWVVDEWQNTGIDGSATVGFGTPIGASSGSGTNPTVTIAAFADAVNNAAYACMVASNSITAKSGYTTLGSDTTNANIKSEFKLGEDTTPGFTLSSSSYNLIGVEVKVPAAAGAGVVPFNRARMGGGFGSMSGGLRAYRRSHSILVPDLPRGWKHRPSGLCVRA